MSKVEVVLAAGAQLAECPFWLAGELLWIDADRGELHRTNVASGTDTTVRFELRLGAVIPEGDDSYVAATEAGFAVIEAGRMKVLDPVAAAGDLFMNDGACDRTGRFWSSVNGCDEAPGRGCLRVWMPGAPSRRVDDGGTLFNGIAWSPDDTVMYVVDSVPRELYAYDFDLASGTVGNRRVLRRFGESDGLPDGLAVDAEGGIWVACYGGWSIWRLTPSGATAAHFELPVSRPTSCAFGDDHDLYVTSAREGLTPALLREEPLAGSIFLIDAGVAGTPVARAVL